MPVVFDSTILIDLFNPKVKGDQRAALDGLLDDLHQARSTVLIPAPCLAELLVCADKAGAAYSKAFGNSSAFEVIPFDTRAATECAILLKQAWAATAAKKVSKTKFKYDWMIVACAASRNVTVIYSDDSDIVRAASTANIRVIGQSELEVPEKTRQLDLPYESTVSVPASQGVAPT